MEQIKKWKNFGITYGIILILIGFLLVFFPGWIISFIAWLLGVVILIVGISKAVTLFQTWRERSFFRTPNAIMTALLLCLGVYMLVNSHVTIAIIGLIVGIFALVAAADRFSVAKVRKDMDMPTSSTIASGIIHLICGIFMVFAPFFAASFIIVVIGAYLIAAGIMIILSSCVFLDL